ncbi:TraB/GumN family protein [Vibrio albus]|uniref:TraB/GumN family protein n=1 Tax=Vibrio albus TaxID=2200953 RepID=A0A2U3BEH8_9VIBR|nr:TraB/GumN family protein [Vibrio albus]PWI35154.1 TraB/GumN family protein [Vibrio albus]
MVMCKKITASLFLCSLFFIQNALAEPLYWKAEKGAHELLIFGSIHMGTPDMYPLPETIIDHLHHSQALITEINLSDVADPQFYTTTEMTRDILNEQQKKRLSDIADELSLPVPMLLDRPSWQSALALQITQFVQLGFSPDYGIDQHLTNLALGKDISILGLETAGYQLQLFSQDNRTGRVLLIDTLNHWERNKKINRCLLETWKAGNSHQLLQLADESEIETELTERFIYTRNQNWAEKLDDPAFLTKPGKYTVAVGAMHLVGPQNLIDLLRKKGFSINRLSKSEPVDCEL